MPISQLELTNTFDEFRLTVNNISNTVNAFDTSITSTTLIAATVTANTLVANTLTSNTLVSNTAVSNTAVSNTLTSNTLTSNTLVANTLVANTLTSNTLVANTLSANNLTSGRVALIGTSGKIQDDAGIAYDPTTDVLTLSGTTDATSPLNGTLVVSGGVGIAKSLYVSGNTYITGNLTIFGSNTELSTTQININDPLLQLANNNTSDLVDIGIFGQYNQGSGNVHTGLFRDSLDDTWKLFKSYSAEPTTKISTSANNFAYANLAVASLTSNANGSFAGTLSVTGNTTFSNTLILNGNFNVNTNKFNIISSSGNTTIAGTLNVSNTIASSSSTTGALTIGGGAGIAGNVYSGGSINDVYGNLRSLPPNAQSTSYIATTADIGRFINTTAGVTINTGVFAIGDNVTIYNNSASSITITQGTSVTLRQAGTTNTGNRTLAQRGVCTVLCVASGEFVINGAGLT
jgi:hypothetical protein